MKFDLKEWINKILSRIVYYDRSREVLSANTSSYASAVGDYRSGALLTLKPNTRYLLLGRGSGNSSNLIQYMSQFYTVSGTNKHSIIIPNQPYATNGGIHPFIAYMETGNSSVKVGVNAYKYTTGFTLSWYVYAIEL